MMRDDEWIDMYYRFGLMDWKSEAAQADNKLKDNKNRHAIEKSICKIIKQLITPVVTYIVRRRYSSG